MQVPAPASAQCSWETGHIAVGQNASGGALDAVSREGDAYMEEMILLTAANDKCVNVEWTDQLTDMCAPVA